jgi:hypothetical protein
MEIEKYSPKWLLEKINASKTDAHKLMHIIEYRKEIVESTEKQFAIHGVVKSFEGKEVPILKDAFIAGYKKRALMSGLKYDEVSELNAITNFKCWKSFDLNL